MSGPTPPPADGGERAPGDEPDPRRPYADAAADPTGLRRARGRTMALAAGLLGVAAALTVAVLVDPLAPWFQGLDDRVAAEVQQLRTPWLTSVAEVLDLAGSVVVTVPLRILALVVLLARRRWTQTAVLLTAIVLSELCIGPLKALVDRPRPPLSLVATGGQSFLSGHSVAAAVTAFGLVLAFLPRARRRLHWLVGASLVAGAMAWSRVYLGAHWATDTVAGICIGAGIALGVEVLAESARSRAAEHAALPPPTVRA